MKLNYCLLLLVLLCASCKSTEPAKAPNIQKPSIDFFSNKEKTEGFFNFYYEKKTGKVWLEVDKLDSEFLYVNSLPAGVGSNDIGLDRGKLGQNRVVRFVRSGPKLLLIQSNYKYRAISDNEDERKSVEEAFAKSVLWGFDIKEEKKGKLIVDATSFIMNDAQKVTQTLARKKQGTYKLDKSRSTVYLPMCKSFPKNTEFEALLTFTGQPKGSEIRSVVPTPEALTVRQRHSFVELPDDNYEPRKLDPRSGFFGITFYDYATPIGEPLEKKYINRHRLEKKNPEAEMSEVIEPIVYYLDRGAPEPVRSALLDGARWWTQAFEAAGFKNAYRVEILPEGADPMDIRYNVIQWVHRSTRGWSYGNSVSDPRTGEIIKGHVSLGSLRVRQDFLIAQGLLAPYENGKTVSKEMEEMALARLRQLSAHEVGHTLGLTHNFAASVNNRSSVMDYPHPYITMREDRSLDFSKAYDDKIGEWDKRTILYGYQDFPKEANEEEALNKIIEENITMGLQFISDEDARPQGGAHPYAHLWDNGGDAVAELDRLLKLRSNALSRFGENNIPANTAMSDLEEVLAPLYFGHRYQVEAVAKLIGGMNYSYNNRGDGQKGPKFVPTKEQSKAVDALLETISSNTLSLPENILRSIPPKTFSSYRSRESFASKTGLTFDPLTAAESAARHSIHVLLHPERAARLVQQHAYIRTLPSLESVIEALINKTWKTERGNDLNGEISRITDQLVIHELMRLSINKKTSVQVRAIAFAKIKELQEWMMTAITSADESQKAHLLYALSEISRFWNNPKELTLPEAAKMPDGSPIGSYQCGH
ncbi:MAG: zinc-dependent metalloprotease [Saprospiraceae bacterium]